MKRACVYACAGLLAAACSTYQPPKLPPSQLAVVVPHAQASEERVYIDGVDGKPVSGSTAINLHTDDNGVYLTPGRHTLQVRLREGIRETELNVWLPAQAGRRYRVQSQVDAYGVSARIVDTASGEAVGGLVENKPP
jgi:hypothetical protein